MVANVEDRSAESRMKKRCIHEPTLLSQENRDLRARQQRRDFARAQARQDAADRAAQLRAECAEIRRTPLLTELSRADREAIQDRVLSGLHPLKGSVIGSWG